MITGTLSSGEDVTERRAAEEQITYLAYHDTLTGLANRTLLEEQLKLALARAGRTGAEIALLHVDLDHFKLVNDSLGHSAGDELMRLLTARLQQSLRATDMLARAGGDGFLVLLADLHDDPVVAAERVAAEIGACLAEPFMVAGAEFQVTASIGIALSPRDAADAEALLAHADSAMYQAKETARGGSAVYRQAGRDPLERLAMAARLRRALVADEFQLHYQPIFARGGELVGAEALLRWHDRERGELVAPSEFIPVAEDTGLIESIGDWVIAAACAQQVEWAARGLSPQISVNVSPRQLRRADFIDRIKAHLDDSGADPARITIELTESAMLQDHHDAEAILRELDALGLQLALDDFGAGYSSLSRLREMPVGTLKIDRAFLREVPGNADAAAIVTAILQLARALGRTAVAEGVETEDQRRFLEEQGCPLMQGFLLARPMPAPEIEALMAGEPGRHGLRSSAAMSWRVTVRDGPRVQKLRAAALEEALDLVEREARVLAAGPRRRTVDLRARSFEPQQQVAGRVELAGPRVRAGVDVRGDGAAEAWTGRVRRQVVEQEDRESPYDALRRVLAQRFSAEP